MYTTQAALNATVGNELSWVKTYATILAIEEQEAIKRDILFQYHTQTKYIEKRPSTPELRIAAEAASLEQTPDIERLKLA